MVQLPAIFRGCPRLLLLSLHPLLSLTHRLSLCFLLLIHRLLLLTPLLRPLFPKVNPVNVSFSGNVADPSGLLNQLCLLSRLLHHLALPPLSRDLDHTQSVLLWSTLSLQFSHLLYLPASQRLFPAAVRQLDLPAPTLNLLQSLACPANANASHPPRLQATATMAVAAISPTYYGNLLLDKLSQRGTDASR